MSKREFEPNYICCAQEYELVKDIVVGQMIVVRTGQTIICDLGKSIVYLANWSCF